MTSWSTGFTCSPAPTVWCPIVSCPCAPTVFSSPPSPLGCANALSWQPHLLCVCVLRHIGWRFCTCATFEHRVPYLVALVPTCQLPSAGRSNFGFFPYRVDSGCCWWEASTSAVAVATVTGVSRFTVTHIPALLCICCPFPLLHCRPGGDSAAASI